MIKYQQFIEDNLTIINKNLEEVPFKLNKIQASYAKEMSSKDIILKARQEGFSTYILATFFADFILRENSSSVVVADKQTNAIALLDRVKYYIKAYELKTGTKVPLKYNSKYQLVNAYNQATYTIGTAQEVNFGRSRTISNLHLSEGAYYPDLRKMLAGAAQAVVPDGRIVIETTANGFNDFKNLWDESVLRHTGYKALFYKASMFYTKEYLHQKKRELGESLFMQEYPETPEEAFITSGDTFFDKQAMRWYLEHTRLPMALNNAILVDDSGAEI